ncbi:MAG: Xaa-Pro peptidase family protein [Beijerinckiaceae bacterium]
MMHLKFDLAARQPYLDADFNDAEYDARLARVRAGMAADGLDALVVFAGPATYASCRWLTNFEPVFGSVFVVVRADGVTVCADGMLHAEPMHSMVWNCRMEDLRCAAGPVYGGPPDEVASLAADACGTAKHVGLAGGSLIPAPLHVTLMRRLGGLTAADSVISQARMFKSPAEIAHMERSGRIADTAFEALFNELRPGMLETEAAAVVVNAMHREGAIESFRTCVVGGKLSGLKHAYPRERKLESGEMLFLDLGASYRGYASDTSRTGVLGAQRNKDQAELIALSEDLYKAGLEKMRPGNTIDDVAQALMRTARGSRFEKDFYASGFGHGIGLDLFEAPGGLFAGSMAVFQPGMTVAYEPMVVVEGLGTGVVEDTILITDAGYRLLTNSRHWL